MHFNNDTTTPTFENTPITIHDWQQQWQPLVPAMQSAVKWVEWVKEERLKAVDAEEEEEAAPTGEDGEEEAPAPPATPVSLNPYSKNSTKTGDTDWLNHYLSNFNFFF